VRNYLAREHRWQGEVFMAEGVRDRRSAGR
jgi:hypothetical protein